MNQDLKDIIDSAVAALVASAMGSEGVRHLLANLMLYCKLKGIDFDTQLAKARNDSFFEEYLVNNHLKEADNVPVS